MVGGMLPHAPLPWLRMYNALLRISNGRKHTENGAKTLPVTESMPDGRARTDIVSCSAFGLGQTKPHHYWEILRVIWENRDNLPYAWRILRHGVCDGCSLGPRGLRDDAMDGIHLCLVRLQMLRLNTMPALDPAALADAAPPEKL